MPIYIFKREGTFYPINLKDDAEAVKNAECNPGTIAVEYAPTGRIVWEATPPRDLVAENFISSFKSLSDRNHAAMVKQGFWKDRHALIAAGEAVSPELGKYARIAITGMNLALKHSELSEALEGIRHGNPPDDKVPEFTAEEAEYADTIIRIFDTAGERKLRVAEAVIAKMAMNEKREKMHGKLA